MSVNVLYRTSARATGGRDGQSGTLDGAVNVKLSIPKELGGAWRRRRQPGAAFRHRLRRLLSRRHEVRGLAGRTESARRYHRHRNRRHRPPLGRWFRPRNRSRSVPARRRPAGSRNVSGKSPRGLPLFQRHAQQYRREAQRRLNASRWPRIWAATAIGARCKLKENYSFILTPSSACAISVLPGRSRCVTLKRTA